MIKMIKNRIKSQTFHPTPLMGLLINPFFFSRRSLDIAIKQHAVSLSGKVLDVGCGSKPYRDYFKVEEYVGMEVGTSTERAEISADVFYSGNEFPFEDGSFDSVISFQVLEHVENPQLFISEVSRTVRKNGLVLLTVPFVWEEHEVPYDRTRFTSYGLKEIFSKNRMEVLKFQKLSVGVVGIAQLFTGSITVSMMNQSKLIRYLVQLLFVAPVHFIAIVLSRLLPKNDHFYLDNVVLARKLD